MERGILQVLATCYMCNSLESDETAMKNSIDTALSQFAKKNFKCNKLDTSYILVHEIEFNSMNKYQVRVMKANDSGLQGFLYGEDHAKDYLLLVKGAPDILRLKAKFIMDANGNRTHLDKTSMDRITEIQNDWCNMGRRVIMLCIKTMCQDLMNKIGDNIEKYFKVECDGLTIIGLIGLMVG